MFAYDTRFFRVQQEQKRVFASSLLYNKRGDLRVARADDAENRTARRFRQKGDVYSNAERVGKFQRFRSNKIYFRFARFRYNTRSVIAYRVRKFTARNLRNRGVFRFAVYSSVIEYIVTTEKRRLPSGNRPRKKIRGLKNFEVFAENTSEIVGGVERVFNLERRVAFDLGFHNDRIA